MAQPKLRTLVVDDSALYRKFISSVLAGIPNIDVVGTASNGRIALEKIGQLKPDLITVDQEMPELDGLGFLSELQSRKIHVATIMVSSSTEAGAKTTNAALRLGAFDFVLKPNGMGPEEARKQLQANLAPRIEAYAASVASNPKASDAVSLDQRGVTASDCKQEPLACSGPPEIVGIGVSTGGPAALNRILPQIPANFPCPILLVQHMPPKFTESLADDLNRICPMTVREASNGEKVEAGEILIAPGGSQMCVVKSTGKSIIQITDDPPERNCRPAVDYLFRSIADNYGGNSLGVILTGMGDDGTIGCKLLKRAGATIITQNQESCVVYGMPRSVYEAGLSDRVAPLDDIPACLLEAVGMGAVV